MQAATDNVSASMDHKKGASPRPSIVSGAAVGHAIIGLAKDLENTLRLFRDRAELDQVEFVRFRSFLDVVIHDVVSFAGECRLPGDRKRMYVT